MMATPTMSFVPQVNSLTSKHDSISNVGIRTVQQEPRRRHLSLSQLINEPVAPAATVTEDNLHYENIDYQASSMTDVTALLNLNTSSSSTSVEAENSANVKLISSSMEANGAIHLLDSNGRLYYISPSESATNNLSIVTNGEAEVEPYAIPVPAVVDVTADQLAASVSHNIEQASPETVTPKNRKKRKPRVYGERKSGWPKGKKRRVVENRIKPPSSAYVIFARKRRKEIMNEFPYYSFSEVTRIMGKEWTNMETDIKEDYNSRAEEDKRRFKQELHEYQQSTEYQEIMKRKREENKQNRADMEENDADLWDEEMKLYCRICDQRFNNPHNRAEHLAGRLHLNNLQHEIRKQAASNNTDPKQSSKKCTCKSNSKPAADTNDAGDESLSINSTIESIMYSHTEREREIIALRENLVTLKQQHAQYSQEILSQQETEAKLKQELQTLRAWSAELTQNIDNLKMVPILFGVINF